ncbi:MAG: DNA polymerase/3'-5' exonuclease PolX [Phycisphaerales bacterium]|nr:MAG: DNA polymerase/3'-5' exonuclease PolX [Phycisphaerales bacterium]
MHANPSIRPRLRRTPGVASGMSMNERLAAKFEEIGQMLELLGANKFRVIAHEKAARVIRDLPGDVGELASDRERLLALDGIGAKQADKIAEFVETGDIGEHAELRAKVPAGLLDVLSVPGVGPKTVKAMWEQLGVTDLASLQRALDDGSVTQLPRMGAKSVERIKASLKFLESGGSRLPIGVAMPVAERLVAMLREVEGVAQAEFAGSLRRGVETIGDIDILACVENDEAAARAHKALREGVVDVVGSGETKTSVRVSLERNFGRWKGHEEATGPTVQVDLRTVPGESFGAALMYFTGSKAHNVALRERAQKQKLTLNEYGLFPDDGKSEGSPQSRGVKPVAGKTEGEIYKKLGVAVVPPELREDRGELDADLPGVIELEDIKAELHAHTTESDGEMALAELVRRAHERGFHTIAVTDHSKSATVANGLSPERLKKQRAEIERLHEQLDADGVEIDVLCGSEVDILADGSLDYDDDVLAALDFIVASPHAALSQDTKTATKRLLRAIEHPLVHVIGHPTGRLIGRRAGLEPAMGELFAAAKEHDVALEINAHWMRLDLRDTHVRAAGEAGVKIAIDCDVHAPADFDNLRYGVLTARRGWLPKDLCVNAMTRAQLRAWVRSKRS